jgi:hypothetical protein
MAPDQPQQFGGHSDHIALWERLYDLAEQRARRVRGFGGAGVGAVPLDILAAHFLILFDTDLRAQRGISGP